MVEWRRGCDGGPLPILRFCPKALPGLRLSEQWPLDTLASTDAPL